jgi:hypothetical protein
MFGNPNSKPKARIERSALRLLPYRFVIKHCDGATNIADWISRNPVESELKDSDQEITTERYVNMSRTELIEAMKHDE